mgnify:CR=1 FL=1
MLTRYPLYGEKASAFPLDNRNGMAYINIQKMDKRGGKG